MKQRGIWIVIMFALLVAGCSLEPSRFDILQENPMSNPTLSFAEPMGRSGTEGDSDPFLGNATFTQLTTRFEGLPADLIDQGLDELIAQAVDAGFELEGQEFSGGGIRSELWQGFDSEGFHLRILVSCDSFQVELR